jgi:hypothetical protein
MTGRPVKMNPTGSLRQILLINYRVLKEDLDYKLNKKMDKFKLSEDQLARWLKNLIIYTAPILAVFFYQLSQGVSFKQSVWVALVAFYALLADYFKKLNQ